MAEPGTVAMKTPPRKIVYPATPTASVEAFQVSATLVDDVAWAVTPAGREGASESAEGEVSDRSSTWKLSPAAAEVCTTRNEIVSPVCLAT